MVCAIDTAIEEKLAGGGLIEMLEAKQMSEITFRDFHPVEVFPADIDGDGRIELVWLDSAGIFQSDVYQGDKRGIENWNKDVFCLTATDQVGRILWQVRKTPSGNHHQTAHYISHVADQRVYPLDIDGDGKTELLVLWKDRLQVYDAETGTLKQERMLTLDNFDIVMGAYKSDGSARILVKNAERSWEPYLYGNPTLILDSKLGLVKELRFVEGAGHLPRIYDVNQDEEDEWLIGYCAFDLDGNVLWVADRQRNEEYDPARQHVDQLRVDDVNMDGCPEIFYAGSDCVYLVNSNGRLLWKFEGGHPQHAIAGNFLSSEDQQIIVHYHSSGGRLRNPVRAFSADGRILWEKTIQDNWPLGKPKVVGNQIMHGPEAILKLPQGAPGGLDAVITDEWGWPQALGPKGEKCFDIPCPSSSVEWPDAVRFVDYRYDDYGYGYRARIMDFNNDGYSEILIHDRYHAWLFKPPLPSKHQLRPDLHTRILPFTGQPLSSTRNAEC